MMLHLSRHTVRQGWPPYVGSAVAMSLGVTLIALTVTLLAAVDTTATRAGTPAEIRTQLSDLASLFGVMSAVAMFMALFVVGSTFGFVVAARRRELGLLRLVGATPRQVRRLVLGESLVVAVLASFAGVLLAALLSPALLWSLHQAGMTPVRLETPAPWLAATIAVPAGVFVALLGSWRSSRRAAKISPAAALLESSVERRRVSLAQFVVGTICLSGSVVALVLTTRLNPLFALLASVLLPEVIVIGLVCFGGVLFPGLAGLLLRPFVRGDVTARVARGQVRAAARTSASMAAPVLAISAIAGSMIVSLSFTADWATGLDRDQLNAPLVVTTGGDAGAVRALSAAPEVAVLDQRLNTTVALQLGDEWEPTDVEGVDVQAARTARGLTAVDGDLAALGTGGAAVSESYLTDAGVGLGDSLRLRLRGKSVRLPVRAVVRDAPNLHGDILVPRHLVEANTDGVVPDLVFVTLRAGVDPGNARDRLAEALGDSDARIAPAQDWIEATDGETRAMNQVGLWMLLGPSGLYAGIAVVNTILMGALQRRRELEAIGLVGATPEQVRRMALWEAGSVGGAALLLGGLTTLVLGWVIRRAIGQVVAVAPLTIPWVPLAAIGATAVALVLVAALTGSAAAIRPRHVAGTPRESP